MNEIGKENLETLACSCIVQLGRAIWEGRRGRGVSLQGCRDPRRSAFWKLRQDFILRQRIPEHRGRMDQ
jgi:hypothetical protein